VETGRAPLRETLAAGLLWLCGYDGGRPFLDPMCGAGTIALEACSIALGVAPGLARSFAFERWPRFDAAAWERLRDQALSAIRPAPRAPLFAFDRDPEAVEIARRNAGRAGFLAHLEIERAELGERPAPSPPGLLVVNPPYGRRIWGGCYGRGSPAGARGSCSRPRSGAGWAGRPRRCIPSSMAASRCRSSSRTWGSGARMLA
jgi:putative N6-adenine-specific DNA methylase